MESIISIFQLMARCYHIHRPIILAIIVFTMIKCSYGYRPVILVHGIMSQAEDLADMEAHIEKYHPGTEVIKVKLYPEVEAFVPLARQIYFWLKRIQPIMDANSDGIHALCHSQGGLICQGIAEMSDNHTIRNFIGLSSPLAGQFGIPKVISDSIPWTRGARTSLSTVMYTRLVQYSLSVSNYWRDPRPDYEMEYINYSRYLPMIHNHPRSSFVDDSLKRTRNFKKLKNVILIGGPHDEVIKPWQSSQFGFYDEHIENIVPMEEQEFYQGDWFGLKTIYKRGDLHRYTFPDINHHQWHSDEKVFKEAIEQWLD